MGTRRHVVVVKQKRGCLVTGILLMVFMLLFFMVAPTCAWLGFGTAVVVNEAIKENEKREREEAEKRAAEEPPPLTAEEDPVVEEPPPPPPWDGYEVAEQPDEPDTRQENQKRLLRYDKAARRVVSGLASGAPGELRDYLDAVYGPLAKAQPSFPRLPKEVQREFLTVMFRYSRDRDTIAKVTSLQEIAADWAASK